MIWLAIAATLAVGFALGRATTIRTCARLLRDTCHYDAANLIDPTGDTP